MVRPCRLHVRLLRFKKVKKRGLARAVFLINAIFKFNFTPCTHGFANQVFSKGARVMSLSSEMENTRRVAEELVKMSRG